MQKIAYQCRSSIKIKLLIVVLFVALASAQAQIASCYKSCEQGYDGGACSCGPDPASPNVCKLSCKSLAAELHCGCIQTGFDYHPFTEQTLAEAFSTYPTESCAGQCCIKQSGPSGSSRFECKCADNADDCRLTGTPVGSCKIPDITPFESYVCVTTASLTAIVRSTSRLGHE